MDYDRYKLRDWISIDQLNMCYLSSNPCPEAMRLLRERPDNMYWYWLARNPCPEAIEMIKENLHKIKLSWLSANTNPEAINLLREHPDKINYISLSSNPNIFKRDYIKMSEERTMTILEDLMKNTLHPRRIIHFLELGGDMDDYLIN